MLATDRRIIVAGEDVELNEWEVPYVLIRNLGHGGFGLVEEVKDVTSNRHFAKKKMRLDSGPLKEVKNMFKQEVEVIRELQSHPHVINVHATYICGRELNIVLEPVADRGDLARVLSDFRDGNEDDREVTRAILHRAYGCLAKCLEFIHSDKHINFTAKEIIRHKDIKPKNILVHEGYVLFTDFGISKRCIDGITTTNDNGPISPLYSAPEVTEDTRNRKADVFSLGCVFLEIFLALRSHHRPASRANPYSAQVDDIQDYLKTCSSSGIAGIIHDMLHVDPKRRPSASGVVTRLSTADEEVECKKCTGQERLRAYWISQRPGPNNHRQSVPTAPTVEYGEAPETATISMESSSKLYTPISTLYPQRRRSLSLGSSNISSQEPGSWDDRRTSEQAHSSNRDSSGSFQPSQHTVDDSYAPVYHLLSHDQIQRYPHISPYPLAPPNRIHDHNDTRTHIALPSSFSRPFRTYSLLAPETASNGSIHPLLEELGNRHPPFGMRCPMFESHIA